jgi:dTDP-4-amino-4,6-dideoxygalactose transaminase
VREELRAEPNPIAGKPTITGVPLLDLKEQYQSIKDEIREAMDRVIQSQMFILGPEVEALEKEIAAYCGCKHAVGVTSGTDALLVSMMALDIGPGDEVITSPFTFFSTVGSILRLGAKVVFADIDPITFNIDPDEVAKHVGSRTKAIIPVHLFGQCADMDPLIELARDRGIPLIEDAAQAIGAEYKGRRAGSMGTLGCFSFFPSKNLGAFGDGGMVTTNSAELADHIRVMRDQGAKPKYYHKVVGGNFRLAALQAAVLRVKLKYLDGWHEKRRANAAFYTQRLTESGAAEAFVIPPRIVNEKHVFNQYVLQAEKRDLLRAYLQENGVSTEVYYPVPIHLQECLNQGGFKAGDFPISEAASNKVLALPIYPELTEEQKSYVVERIREFYSAGS